MTKLPNNSIFPPHPFSHPAILLRLFEIEERQHAVAELSNEVIDSPGPIVKGGDDGKDHRAGKLGSQHVFKMIRLKGASRTARISR